MNLVTRQCPVIEAVGNWYRTRLDGEAVMFTKKQPEVLVKNVSRVYEDDLVLRMRENLEVPDVASEVREPYLTESFEKLGVVHVTWTWYEVTV